MNALRLLACTAPLLMGLLLPAELLAQVRYSDSPYTDSYLRRHSNAPPSHIPSGSSGRRNYSGRGYSYYPGYGYGYGYGYGHGHYYPPGYYGYSPYYLDNGYGRLGPYYFPPIYAPAETAYGPQAVQRFLGVDPRINEPVRGNNILVVPPADRAGDNDRGVRVANAESRARAARYIALGDEQFAAQRFHSALERYKRAVTSAPNMGEAFFRQGHALVALGRYDHAAKAYRRGLIFDPDWPTSEFRLEKLYAGANLAKTAHQEALATASNADPDSSDLLFLLAVHLYFDGHADRARPLFLRAGQLAVDGQEHLEPFLKALAPAEDVVAPKLPPAGAEGPELADPQGVDT